MVVAVVQVLLRAAVESEGQRGSRAPGTPLLHRDGERRAGVHAVSRRR